MSSSPIIREGLPQAAHSQWWHVPSSSKIEAEQKVAQTQAEAKALEVQKQQITPELLQLRTIEMMQQHWDGHLPEVYMGGQGGGALPMIDVLKAAGRTK